MKKVILCYLYWSYTVSIEFEMFGKMRKFLISVSLSYRVNTLMAILMSIL